jgi:hypothetical protein
VTGRIARTIAVGMLAATPFAAGMAAAQVADPTAHYDIDDILNRHPHDVSELPTVAEARGRPVTFNLSGAGTYTSNAGSSRFDEVDTGYVTPGFGIDVTPVSFYGWNIGAGAQIDGDYYAGDYNDAFGEGRIEGFAFADHALGPGTFTAEYIALAIFDNDFSEQDVRLEISDLTYSISSGNVIGEVSAEYHDSNVPELRRTRLTAMAGYAFPTPLLGHVVTVEGDIIFSDFNGGANHNRNDTIAALALIAGKDLGYGWSVEWEAALVNRFSNRDVSRFTAFDLGVEIVKTF